MNSWLKNIQSMAFSTRCTLCGAAGMASREICEACYQSLPINDLACKLCAIPLPPGSAGICGQCVQKPPPYERCIATWRYEPPLDYLVQRLKFNKDLSAARLMAGLFAEHLITMYANQRDKPDVIIPVPLHSKRLRERGFNQAAEIAKIVARQMRIPLNLRACTRVKMTQPQAELPAEHRKRNIKGAFAFHASQCAAPFGRIALLDDVMTTGHTIEELTKTLQFNGQYAVEVWVCARANR
jgi:ComF family protein